MYVKFLLNEMIFFPFNKFCYTLSINSSSVFYGLVSVASLVTFRHETSINEIIIFLLCSGGVVSLSGRFGCLNC